MTRRCGLGVLVAVGLAAIGAAGAAGSELERSVHAAPEAPRQDAPLIVLHAPHDGGTYASPLGIDIGFEPAQGAAIDLSTPKVTVETHTPIGDLSFDITDDVSPYVSPGGIHARRAAIPAGEHTVTISVADTLRRRAEQQLKIIVRSERGLATEPLSRPRPLRPARPIR
jgi:hypothetical protein